MNKKIIPILISSLLFCGCSSDKTSDNDSKEKNTTPTSSNNELIENQEIIADKSKEETTPVSTFEKLVVEYKNNNGESVFDEIEKLSDISLKKPSFLSEKEIFTGWKEEAFLSEISDNIPSSDELLLTAESIDISSMENVIYNNSIYVNIDESDEFILPVTIGGITDFAVMDLEVSYDSDILELVEIISDDSDIMINHIKEEEKIIISFVSIENINADVNLCDLKFKILQKNKNATALSYNVKDIVAWSDDKSDYKNVNYNIVNSKIVMY